MLEQIFEKFSFESKLKQKPNQKIFLTLLILFLFRLGNTIPLAGIDQDALKKGIIELGGQNSILQIINMYSGIGGRLIISPFSLGIIPFINASILIDLLTALIPFLEKLQSEEGEEGRKRLNFYKKILTVIFSIGQSIFLIYYSYPYLYSTDFFTLALVTSELVTGALVIVWLSNIIDRKGIGNGTSIIIFTNIVVNFVGKKWETIFSNEIDIVSLGLETSLLLLMICLICISQTARINIEVVSARQLIFLENLEQSDEIEKGIKRKKTREDGLSIRLNQAGIFPIIIAANLIPFLSYFLGSVKTIETAFYYALIIGFNYFYTIVFWDPEKISEQLRKASVSIVNITPGKETISYLENVVKASSIIGGIFLSTILLSYDLVKQNLNSYFLNQINISSLIILVGVSYELQKTTRTLYKNTFE